MSTATDRQMYRVTIEASIDTVWAALTKEGEVLPFFFGSVLHTPGLKPGAPYRMRTPNGKHTAVAGEVLEFDPPHRYATTFQFTNLDDPPCKVIYELKEVDEGVEFTLITEGVTAGTKTAKNMAQGGPFIVNTMKRYIETGNPGMMAKMIMVIGRLTAFMTPKRCLSSNWE